MHEPVASQRIPTRLEQSGAESIAPEESVGSLVRTIDPTAAPKAQQLRSLLSIFTSNRKALAGICILLFFVLVGLIGPLFITTDPNAFSSDILAAPSAAHWFGTTQTGQDVFAQVVVGTRSSVFWGLATGLISTFLAVLIGITAGYLGGIVDEALSLLTNVFLLLPGFVLAVILAAYSPVKGPIVIAFLLALTTWSYQARVLRAQTLSIRSRDFVDAAKANGESTWRILTREILPNEIAIVAAGFIGTALYVILAAAGLEFLGLGNVTSVDWGTMFYWAENSGALLQGAWWWFAPPGLCIALLGAGLALINNGIDEVADPRLRGEPSIKQKISRFSIFRGRKAQQA